MTEKPESGPTPENEQIVPGQAETPDTTAEDAAHKREMEELFGDIADEDDETPEDIKAERDELRQKLIDLSGMLGSSQKERQTLSKQLETQKAEVAGIISRIERNAEEQKPFALEKFMKEVLPVVDNMERGLEAISKEQRAADVKFEKMAQGMEKTLGQLTAVFNKFGVKAIDPKGQSFDPEKHEAISVVDDPGAESDTVVVVVQKGYELNGRLIRPAKVVVKP